MKITKEQFKELAKKHLIALEGYDLNRTIEIFGVERLYDEVIKIEQQINKNKAREFLIERSEGMTSERIKEIQEQTAYPESASVMLALMQVWNECEQEQSAKNRKIENTKPEFKREDVVEFKAGDILIDAYDVCGGLRYISIFKEKSKLYNDNFSAFIVFDIHSDTFRYPATNWDGIKNNRLATEEEKQLLFDALKKEGKRWNAEKLEVEELDISEIVVDYESAINYLGIKDTLLVFKNYDRANKFNAQIKLQLIAEAWNKFDEFEADWGNIDQYKHYPILRVKDGKIEFSHTCFVRRFINSYTSNFSFKTEERATQFGEQFIDLFKVAMGF